MNRILSLLLTILSAFLFVKSVAGIQCYECNSNVEGSRCLTEKLDPKLLVDCKNKSHEGPEYTLCRKITQWVDQDYAPDMKAEERIVRTCGYEKTDRDCYYRAGFGGRMEVCTCNTDHCNGAISVTIATTAVLAPLLAMLLSRLF